MRKGQQQKIVSSCSVFKAHAAWEPSAFRSYLTNDAELYQFVVGHFEEWFELGVVEARELKGWHGRSME